MNPVIKRIKEELKAEAETIKILKQGRKPKNYKEEFHRDLWKLPSLRNSYRIQHIAYCEIRGVPRDRIEKPRDNNKPDDQAIKKIKDQWLQELNEFHEQRQAICVNS